MSTGKKKTFGQPVIKGNYFFVILAATWNQNLIIMSPFEVMPI